MKERSDDWERPKLDHDTCVLYAHGCLSVAAYLDMDNVCMCGGACFLEKKQDAAERISSVGGGRCHSMMAIVEEEDSFGEDVCPLSSHKTVGSHVGDTFGHVTILGMSGTKTWSRGPGKPKATMAVWSVMCSCGEKFEVNDSTVKSWIRGAIKNPRCRTCQSKRAKNIATSASIGTEPAGAAGASAKKQTSTR